MKKLTLLIAILLATTTFAQVPNYVPTNGLVGWWPFNGNANDESGNGYNGTVNGATLTSDRFSSPNKAYTFDNSEITVQLSSSNFSSDYTLSIWLKMNPNNASFPTFLMGNNVLNGATDPNFFVFQFINSLNQFSYYMQIAPAIGGNALIQSNTANENEWYHLVISSSNQICSMYINGTLNNIVGPIYLSNSGNYLHIGNGRDSGERFIGQLDELGIWNRALTDCEIKDLYYSQLGSTNSTSSETQTALDNYTWPLNNQTYTQSGTYSDTLVNAAGCDSIVTLNLTLNYTGINENNSSSLVISPNPTTGAFTIVGLELYNTISTMRVSDVNGKLVKELDPSASKFTLETVKSGVYFLTITAGDKQEVIKIIKE
jgi:hypothetical protein